ncbi:hypothetical protein BGAL_0258g00010 [Botrytis galanthina]|uniref:Uncharacterized protein n=1 Tax=Botrytis galanthina TaxID=278940 RepID=A0A4S8QT16_9HELO|nr:hypothetical protein BGAL_0258g00010 [Botrytis galanthina]
MDAIPEVEEEEEEEDGEDLPRIVARNGDEGDVGRRGGVLWDFVEAYRVRIVERMGAGGGLGYRGS